MVNHLSDEVSLDFNFGDLAGGEGAGGNVGFGARQETSERLRSARFAEDRSPPRETTRLQQQPEEVDALISALQQSHRALSRERERAREQEELLRSLQRQHEELRNRSSREIEELRAQLDARATELARTREQAERLKLSASGLEEQNKFLHQKYERAQETSLAIKSELDKRGRQIQSISSDHAELLAKTKAREKQIHDHYTARLNSISGDDASRKESLKRLEEEVTRLRSEREILRNALTALANEKARIEARLQAAQRVSPAGTSPARNGSGRIS